MILYIFFFFSSRRRHTRLQGDWIQTCALPIFTREGVKIITGTFSSRLCGAASEAAARHTVIYWETSCVDPRFNKRGLTTVFRTEIDATGFGWYNVEFIAKHLAPRFNMKANALKIAFLSEDSSYGQGVTESARVRAKQRSEEH